MHQQTGNLHLTHVVESRQPALTSDGQALLPQLHFLQASAKEYCISVGHGSIAP